MNQNSNEPSAEIIEQIKQSLDYLRRKEWGKLNDLETSWSSLFVSIKKVSGKVNFEVWRAIYREVLTKLREIHPLYAEIIEGLYYEGNTPTRLIQKIKSSDGKSQRWASEEGLEYHRPRAVDAFILAFWSLEIEYRRKEETEQREEETAIILISESVESKDSTQEAKLQDQASDSDVPVVSYDNEVELPLKNYLFRQAMALVQHWRLIALLFILLIGVGLSKWYVSLSSPEPLVVLEHYWHPQRLDNHLTGTNMGQQKAQDEGYQEDGQVQGFIYPMLQPGTLPLERYFNEERGDYVVLSTSQTRKRLEAEGYQWEELEGYIFPTQQPGTVPLQLYFAEARGDYFATATSEGQQLAERRGYELVGTEGFLFMPNRDLTVRSATWKRVCARDLSVLVNFKGPLAGELYSKFSDKFYEVGRNDVRSYGYAEGAEHQGVGWVLTEYLCTDLASTQTDATHKARRYAVQ
jgi:hypothetical protein